jgi:hypothetical protein
MDISFMVQDIASFLAVWFHNRSAGIQLFFQLFMVWFRG